MIRRIHRSSAFSLIELMIVLAIVGIMATLALSTSVGNRPRTRLVSGASNLRLEMLKVRTAAVRVGRNYKACFFRANVADTAAPPANTGMLIVFACNTPGLSGCPGTLICSGHTGAQAFTGTIDVGTVASPCKSELEGATANRWCRVHDLGFDLASTSSVDSYPGVAITRLSDFGLNNPVTQGNALELTYLPSGFIDSARSTSLHTSGNVEFGNRDLCRGTCTAVTDFTQRSRVEYVTGGGARLTD